MVVSNTLSKLPKIEDKREMDVMGQENYWPFLVVLFYTIYLFMWAEWISGQTDKLTFSIA